MAKDRDHWTFTCALCGREVDEIRIICRGGNSIYMCIDCHEYGKTHYSELAYVKGGAYEIS